MLPQRDDVRATCVAATEDFCVYGTSSGTIEYFYFAEWTLLAGVELRHEEAIRAVYPNPKGARPLWGEPAGCWRVRHAPLPAGTRLVFIDGSYRGFLFSPVNHGVLPIPKLHETTRNILWDAADWGVFATTDHRIMNTYIHSPFTINGPQITQLGHMEIKGGSHPVIHTVATIPPTTTTAPHTHTHMHSTLNSPACADNGDMVMEAACTDVPYGHTPVMVHDGVVTCQTPSGSISTFVLKTHDCIMKVCVCVRALAPCPLTALVRSPTGCPETRFAPHSPKTSLSCV